MWYSIKIHIIIIFIFNQGIRLQEIRTYIIKTTTNLNELFFIVCYVFFYVYVSRRYFSRMSIIKFYCYSSRYTYMTWMWTNTGRYVCKQWSRRKQRNSPESTSTWNCQSSSAEIQSNQTPYTFFLICEMYLYVLYCGKRNFTITTKEYRNRDHRWRHYPFYVIAWRLRTFQIWNKIYASRFHNSMKMYSNN